MEVGVYRVVTDSVTTAVRTSVQVTSGQVATGSLVSTQPTIDNTDPAWPALDILLTGPISSHTSGATVDVYIRYLDVFGSGTSEPEPGADQEIGLIHTFGVDSGSTFVGTATDLPITHGKFELYFVPRGVTFAANTKLRIRRSSGAPKRA